jgi:hypothetical protein
MNCANHPDRERIAFCQNCGKPLCQECARTVGSAVFCEPCLAAKLAGTGSQPSGTYTESPAGSYAYTGNPGGADYTGAIPPPSPPGAPNPGLAALLGIIPGVGAMYNGQYAKGVVHLVVFALLITLANENGIFGLFIAGWVCYQVIEAYHTARARRDGTPLPNPFGLNDLGERLGFGRSWPGSASTAAGPASGPATSPAGAAYAPPPAGAPYPPPPPSYPPQQPYAANAPWESFAPPIPPIPPYGAPSYPLDPPPITGPRFPAGALWLIGLGCIFLIGNAGLFHGFPIHRLVPFLLIGLGVWLFVHRMTDTGAGLTDDGTPGYQLRVFRALRGSVWVIVVGVLFLLDEFDILSWGRSWPFLIIIAGLMAIFQRVTYSSAAAASYPYPYPPQPVTPPPAPGTAIVPSTEHDQEGS